jgi:hypothetical protein
MAHHLYTNVEVDMGRAQQAMARLLQRAASHRPTRSSSPVWSRAAAIAACSMPRSRLRARLPARQVGADHASTTPISCAGTTRSRSKRTSRTCAT